MFFFKIKNRVISWEGWGDVRNVGKIEIEGNGEKKQINTIVHREEPVGLKHPVRQRRQNLTK